MTQAWFRTFSAFALCPLPHFPKLTVPWSNPSGPMTWLKTCWPTWASRAARGSSSRYTAALLYTARAKLSRCFWPPERVMPCGHKRGAGTDLHLLGEALGTGAMSAHQSEPRLTGPLLYRPLQLETHALRPTSPPPASPQPDSSPLQPSFLDLSASTSPSTDTAFLKDASHSPVAQSRGSFSVLVFIPVSFLSLIFTAWLLCTSSVLGSGDTAVTKTPPLLPGIFHSSEVGWETDNQ